MDIVDAFMFIIGLFVFLPIFCGLAYLLVSCMPEKADGAKDLLLRIIACCIPALVTGCFSLGLILLIDFHYGEATDVNETVAIAFSVVGSILIAVTLVVGVTIKILQKKRKSLPSYPEK